MLPSLHCAPSLCNDLNPKAKPGGFYRDGGGQVFLYARARDAVVYAAGQVCTLALKDRTEVTNDRAGGSSIGAIFGGIAMCVLTQNYYGYFLMLGYWATIVTSGADDIAIGESLIVHAATDGTCDGVAANATTTASFGIATEADSDANNTVAGIVNGF